MIIQSIGIITRVDSFKERGLIVRCFTKLHGKVSGFIRLPSKKFGSYLVPGNICNVRWQARLEEHLGSIKLETVENIFYKTQDAFNSNVINYITVMLEHNFQERVKSEKLYNMASEILIALGEVERIKLIGMIFNFEFEILSEMGYRLNLAECAITKSNKVNELYYLSPKTGAACTKEAGTPYKDKLFIIPSFFISGILEEAEIKEVGSVMCHFLKKHELISNCLVEIRNSILYETVEITVS